MFNFWEQFILSAFLGVLSGLKRNPLTNPTVKAVLVHVLDDVCQILGVQAPVVP